MNENLFSFVWQHSKRDQYVVLALTCAMFPLLYLSLEIPKQIINDALSGDVGMRELLGLSLTPVQYLLFLSFSLLALVVLSGVLKMRLNTFKGVVGERLVRRLRYQLIERLLRFPLRRFQRVSQGEVIATVVSETEPLSGFSSEAVALPVFQGGTLITILVFMFAQSWQLGLASLLLVPVQVLLIPRLQKRINALRKKRIARARALSQRLGETVDLVEEIRVQGTRRYTLAEFSYRLGELFHIRLELFERKFFMKFLNNTINQLTPFLFYAVGGLLVLKGQLSIGALVAAIAAHKDFIAPWRELLNFYQTWQDSVVKYRQIVLQYAAAVEPNEHTTVVADEQFGLQALSLQHVSCVTDGGDYVLRGVDFTVPLGKTIAVVGEGMLARRYFGRVLAGLDEPSSGVVCLGQLPIHDIDESSLRQNIAYVNGEPKLFNAAMSYNLIYGLNHSPPETVQLEQFNHRVEAREAGNSEDWYDESYESNWLNAERLGLDGWDDFGEWVFACLKAVEADKVIDERAFFEVFDPTTLPAEQMRSLGERLLTVRQQMTAWLAESPLQPMIDHFDERRLNTYATLSENFLYGTIADQPEPFSTQAVRDALKRSVTDLGLASDMRSLATRALHTLLRLHQDLPSNHPMAVRFDLHNPERLARLKHIAAQIETIGGEDLSERCQADLMDLCLRLVPGDWPSLDIEQTLSPKIFEVRQQFCRWLAEHFGERYHRFEPEHYNPGISVLDNVLFGRLAPNCDCQETLLHQAQHLAEEAGVLSDLRAQFAFSTQAGLGGSRLPNIAHHRINLTRSLLKKPRLLIMHDALTNSSLEQQANIRRNIRELLPDITLIWINSEISNADEFDQVFDLHEDRLDQRQNKQSAKNRLLSVTANETVTRVSVPLLQSIPLLSVLNPEQLELIALHSQLRQATAGQQILWQEDRPVHTVVMLSGQAQALAHLSGSTFEIEVDIGELVGELEVIAQQPRHLELFAQTDCQYLLVDASILNSLLDESPTLAQRMLRNVSKRILQANLSKVAG